MNTQQEYTPKYWVGHIKTEDDVILDTASKSRHEACRKMEEIYGDDWFMDELFGVDLLELKICKDA